MYTDIIDIDYEVERQENEVLKLEEHLDSLPKLLFKYKPLTSIKDLDRFIDILKNNKIYMPNYLKLNDPLEGTNARLLGVEENVRDSIRKKWQILSFSSDVFIPTLWAYYASNYNGVCIGFNTHPTFDDIRHVDYVEGNRPWTCEPDTFIEEDFTKKNICWKYESEWRIIRKAIYNTNDEVVNNFFEFHADDIAHIFVGYNISQNIIEIIKNYVPKSTNFWRIKPASESFGLQAENLSNDIIINNLDKLLEFT